MYDRPRYLPAGDRALFMELGDGIEEECNAAIRGIVDFIRNAAGVSLPLHSQTISEICPKTVYAIFKLFDSIAFKQVFSSDYKYRLKFIFHGDNFLLLYF